MARHATAAAFNAEGNRSAAAPPRHLAEAYRRVIYTDGFVTLLADQTGFDAKDLRRWATDPDNASGEHREPPACSIVPITRARRRYDIVEWLCDQVGGIFVPRPALAGGAGALLARVAALTAEFGDVQIAAAAALTGGMEPEEAAALDGELAQLAREVEAARLAIAPLRRPLAKAAR